MDPEVVKILLEIKTDTAATRQAVEDLTGDHGRVTRLEMAQNNQWWVTIGIAPALAILHALARKFGVNV